MKNLTELLQRVLAVVTVEHRLIGASLTRISFGLCTLYLSLLHYRQRWYLWGPDAVWPQSEFASELPSSLYALSDSPLVFDVLFHLSILVACAFTLGWHTRAMSVLNFIFVFSLQNRNEFILDGGDNFARLALFFMMFVNCGEYFSLDRDRKASRPARESSELRTIARQALAIIHNAALLLIVFQLCVVYLVAAMHKISGEMWQQGTAMYYISQVREFSWSPGLSKLFLNEYAMVSATYGTVLWQLSFPFLLVNRWTRMLVLLGGVFFHLGIAYSMRLISFSWFMASAYFVAVPDGEYLQFYKVVHSRIQASTMRWRARSARLQAAP